MLFNSTGRLYFHRHRRMTIIIVSPGMDVLEKIKTSKKPGKFVIYRGRLLERVAENVYTEKPYLELY